ncbi:hypothetical protein ACRQU7_13965 [Caproiciproducens sp. R1]|uniref:hypothetical protein n=1 Tax=Caproiciproducens sp. R1 TaxID=3435000 RepID=UPI004033BA33
MFDYYHTTLFHNFQGVLLILFSMISQLDFYVIPNKKAVFRPLVRKTALQQFHLSLRKKHVPSPPSAGRERNLVAESAGNAVIILAENTPDREPLKNNSLNN